MIKAKRTLTLTAEITVDLGEVDIVHDDDYSKYLHDDGVRRTHAMRLSRDVELALGGLRDISIVTGHSQMSVDILPEHEAEWQAMLDTREANDERLREAVHVIGGDLGVMQCIWSFSESGREDQEGVDYQQGLIDNPLFRAGRVKFIYEDGWDDEKTIECPVVMEDPHYQDVFVAADLLLRLSNDKHHVFIEGAVDKGVDSDGVQVYALYYGS